MHEVLESPLVQGTVVSLIVALGGLAVAWFRKLSGETESQRVTIQQQNSYRLRELAGIVIAAVEEAAAADERRGNPWSSEQKFAVAIARLIGTALADGLPLDEKRAGLLVDAALFGTPGIGASGVTAAMGEKKPVRGRLARNAGGLLREVTVPAQAE